MNGEWIRIRGVVQGVGFRPTVARIARGLALRGWVRNDADGVLVGLLEPPERCAAFVDALLADLPPLARVDAVERSPARLDPATGFTIVHSEYGAPNTGVAPDARACPACLAEVSDPAERRYRYPFTTCTHCGPRLSIATGVPWDRPNTTMAMFPLCDACRREYEDEADRRYHAQPIACWQCGPRARLVAADGAALDAADATEEVAARLSRGEIVALKGIGGYQLLCDATQPEAVRELRRRKRRPHKPLALMARDLAVVRRYADVSDEEASALASPAGPIVLLTRRDGTDLAPEIAPDQDNLGFMLPTTPMHHLVMLGFDRPIVCTSGNLTEEPQATDDEDARARLGGIADVLLVHDRPIANRVDDSVVRWMAGEIRVLRRARGYAPAPLPLPPGLAPARPTLALGPQLKATVCLSSPHDAVVSQHLGDLDDPLTFDHWAQAIDLLTRLYDHRPALVAVDAHDGYRATEVGTRLAEDRGIPLIEVRHHHAHIAAVLAENGWPLDAGPVLGLAFDGLGSGDDGTLWGGEFLWADYRGYTRAASLPAVPWIGGDKAAVEPWRNLYAHLRQDRSWEDLDRWRGVPALTRLREKPVPLIEQILPSAIRGSSAGRLFDAVAAAVGLFFEGTTFEGQAAMALEALVDPRALAPAYPIGARPEGGRLVLSLGEMWAALLDDLAASVPAPAIAARFHASLADGVVRVAERLADGRPRVAALSGGVWQNRVLTERVAGGLAERGWKVLLHRQLPPNDGCIAFGQAVVAAARER